MVINVPITVDEELLEKTINQDYTNKVDSYLYSKIDYALAEMDPSWNGKSAKKGLDYLVEETVKRQVLSEWKDEIIEKAATLLANRIEKTKAAKELI